MPLSNHHIEDRQHVRRKRVKGIYTYPPHSPWSYVHFCMVWKSRRSPPHHRLRVGTPIRRKMQRLFIWWHGIQSTYTDTQVIIYDVDEIQR